MCKINKYFLYFSLFIICMSFHIYFSQTKTALTLDESLSFIISEYKEYGWTKNFTSDKEYSGSELRSILYGETSSIVDALSDIHMLHINNRDSPHTNLYYSLLRVFCVNLDGTLLENVIFRGELLNIFLLALIFISMVVLYNKLYSNAHSLSLSLYFFSVAAIENTLLIRPYQLQTLMFVVGTCIFVDLYKDVKLGTLKISILKCVFYAIVISLLLLSGYFSVFYVFPLFLFLMYSARRNKIYVYFISCISILSIIFCCIIYCRYLGGFISYRAHEAVSKTISSDLLKNISLSSEGIFKSLSIFFISGYSTFCIFFACFIERKKYRFDIYSILLICSVIFLCASMLTAPYKVLRYILPVFPILAIVIGRIFYGSKKSLKILSILFLISILFNINTKNIISWRYDEKNIYNSGIIISQTIWKLSTIVPYLNKDSKYRIYDQCDNYQIQDDSLVYIENICSKIPSRMNKIGSLGYYGIYK